MLRLLYFLLLAMVLMQPGDEARADAFDCANYWARGHPLTVERTEAIPCREYVPPDPLRIAGGANYRIFYPPDWSEPEYARVLEAVAMGLEDSVLVYRHYGRVPSIYVILTNNTSDRTAAETGSPDVDIFEPCPIIVYRGALSTSVEHLMQTIAHEVFHCFQNENLGMQSSGVWDPVYVDSLFQAGITRWWVESTAEFFSNVVYPTTNAEHLETRKYTPEATIFDQERGYPSAVFFQYLANKEGEEAVLELLSRLPTEGDVDDQARALEQEPGMSALFHAYGESYTAVSGIMDSGGGSVPAKLPAPVPVQIPKPGSYEFLVSSFALNSWMLLFPEAKRVRVSLLDEGNNYRASHRRNARAAWLPSFDREFSTSCLAPEMFDLMMTSLSTSPMVQRVKLVVTMEDEIDAARCGCSREDLTVDQCLVGSWEAEETSLKGKMGGTSRSDLDGAMRVTISADGRLVKRFDGIYVTSINEDLGRFDWTLGGFVEGCLATTRRVFGPGYFTLRSVRQSTDYNWAFTPRAAYVTSPTPGLHNGNGAQPVGLRWHSGDGRTQAYSCSDRTLKIRGLTLKRTRE